MNEHVALSFTALTLYSSKNDGDSGDKRKSLLKSKANVKSGVGTLWGHSGKEVGTLS